MGSFSNEEELRRWLLKEIKQDLKGLPFIVLENKNVNDIIICREDGFQPLVLFLEVKLYKESHGRIGVGTGYGGGFQPEILLKRPGYFDGFLRWVLCNEKDEFLFLDNETIINHVAGGKIEKEKQNNISPNIFSKEKLNLINKDGIISTIKEWAEEI